MKYIKLNKGYFTVIDDEKYEKVSKYKWYVISPDGIPYAYTNIKGKFIYLHRFILNAPKGITVDHRNHDTLDNRCNNLRLATSSQNIMNTRLRSDNTSGHRGVAWDKNKKQWLVRIHVNYKVLYLGRYKDFDKAVQVYEEKAIELFGKWKYQEKKCNAANNTKTING
jgi:hypothetical protein